ncbi:MAG: hypothetical protein CBD88_00460 [Flavobacteriales bacterium TMED228]|nr:MAG: hypothetical protein CBD88_00460 [Flavobacteriales bacterium TMED228]|tara:strand:+ start:9744 stop:10328 length:585 start_codon:yes stop_codon:yes gene_type:complete
MVKLSKENKWNNKVKETYIKGVDEIAIEMEKIWGAGTLEQLADHEIKKKFQRAKDKFNKVISNDVEAEIVVKMCNNMKKGWLAIDKAVRLAGHTPPTGEYWTAISENKKEFLIVKNEADKDILFEKLDGAIVYSTKEIAEILETLHEVNKCKEIFRKAKVEKFDCVQIEGRNVKVTGNEESKKYFTPFDDEIPF